MRHMRNWNDDPFTKKARQENFLARSIYKLEEIDRREGLFRGVKSVIDLGAAPGSWTQYTLRKLPPAGRLLAIDLSPIEVSDPRLIAVQKPIEEVNVAEVFGAELVDLVLSDMAPSTSGMHERDTALSFELASLALGVCQSHLKKGGSFVVKLFMGREFEDYHRNLKQLFGKVRLLRPESTRKQSREIFFVGRDYRR